jgi:hypothetical protein
MPTGPERTQSQFATAFTHIKYGTKPIRQLATALTGLAAVAGLRVAAAPEASATTSGTTTTTLPCAGTTYTVVTQTAAAGATAAARYTDGTNVFVVAISNIIGNAGEPATSCILTPEPRINAGQCRSSPRRWDEPRLICHRA